MFWLATFCFRPATLKRLPGAFIPMIMATQLQNPTTPPAAWQPTSFGTKSMATAAAPTPQILTCCEWRSITTQLTCCSSRLELVCCLPQGYLVQTKIFSALADLGSSHKSVWGSSATLSTRDPRDWRKQETLQGHYYPESIWDPGHKEEHRDQDVSRWWRWAQML